ncbi:MAG: hypothetical protein ABIQ95_13040 [Bdellovibrionia bacterium]
MNILVRLNLLFLPLIAIGGCGSPQSFTLATSSLNGTEIQEDIWQARDSSDTAKAAQLQATLSQVLTQGNCNQTKSELTGVTQKVVLACDQGIGAVVKIKQIPFPFEEPTGRNENAGIPILTGFSLSDANAEMAAYSMDALLQLNVVPTTLRRVVPGVGVGSAQYFVKDTTAIGYDLNLVGFRRMLILDYINNNCDRHSGNWLYRATSNRIVAIDNGRSFRDEATPPVPPPTLDAVILYLQSEPTLTQTLKRVTDAQVEAALNPYLRNYLIQKVLSRIHSIQAKL